MTLIKCPGCGHTILSVASRCPQCGNQLSQFRFVQGQGGSLTECRRCSRKVLSGATTCPYCGTSRPGARPPYLAVALLLLFAVPALVLAALRGRAPDVPDRSPPTALEPPPVERVGAAPATPIPAPAPQPVAVADSTRGTAPESVPASDGTAGVTTETRWTLDWANVREGRALGTRVVRVLRPGSSIQVADRQAGWWALYIDGQAVGYVAGSVLGDQPPPDRPEGERSP